jgi:hypothetical protein
MGTDLGNQTMALLNEAEDLDQVVRTWQGLAPPSMDETQARFSDMLVKFRSIEASSDQLVGLSPSAATHLRDLTQLFSIVSAVIAPAGSTAAANPSSPLSASGNPELDRLNQLAGQLVVELERMDLKVEPAPAPSTPSATARDERQDLVRLVQTFRRLVEASPPMPDIVEAWRVIRTRMWEFERRIHEQSTHPEWRKSWQVPRRGFDAISAELRLPRVLIGSYRSPAVARPDNVAVARVDHALSVITKLATVADPQTSRERVDPRTLEDLRHLRLELLLLRISLLASVKTTRHSPLVRDIDLVDRAMHRRAQVSSQNGRIEHARGQDELTELHRSLVALRNHFVL